jgi:hypothetical protein
MNTIQFYLPYRREVARLPERSEDYWQWSVENPTVPEGKYAWTLQTFLRLREAGLPCELVERFPSSGIVVAHRDLLPITGIPRSRVFLVCIKADRNRHTWAHFHVTQNERDSVRRTHPGKSITITHWPQPGLIPRDPARGALVENVAYFGRECNLAPELRSVEWLKARERLQWHDYREVDVTVSVRQFGQQNAPSAVFDADSKPASKLINSWMAGVPAIVGPEPAYQMARKSLLDFIEVRSADEALQAVDMLRSNPALYRDMVQNGLRRAKEFSADSITAEWLHLFRDVLPAQYREWIDESRVWRKASGCLRFAAYFTKPQHISSVYGALVR